MRLPLLRSITLCVAALVLSAAVAAAQTVTGIVLENATGGPVQGAFVRLLDSDGGQRAAAVSDSTGAFAFRAPRPGTYTIRVDQIGYYSGTEIVEVSGAAAPPVVVHLNVLALALEAVTAVARSRCRVRPESGAETERIWQDARKALDVAAWADRSSLLRYELTTYRRTLDSRRRLVRRAAVDTAFGVAQRPFETPPVEALLSRGFIHPMAADEYMFYAPDAHILLSDEFLSTHCFWVETPKHARHRGMIGLAFEPVQRRDVSDIAGVLWVDVASGRLRMLEYAYRRIPWDLPDNSADGRVEFRRLPGGTWIIQSWFIRVPRVEVTPHASGRRTRVVGFEEAGGDVRSLVDSRGVRLPDAPP